MTYNPGIPLATDRISDSQLPILTNFAQANTLTAIDHFQYNYNVAANRGKHKFSTYSALPKIAPADPVAIPTPIVGDGCIYTRTAGAQTIPYYRKDNLAVDFPVVPVRGMTRFQTTPLPVVGAAYPIIGTGFNLTATRLADLGNFYGMQVTFTEAMPNANYLVHMNPAIPSGGAITPGIIYVDSTTILNTGFRIYFSAVSGVTNLFVTVLHYTI